MGPSTLPPAAAWNVVLSNSWINGSILVLWPAIELEKLEELHEVDEEEVAPLPLSLE